MEKQSSPLYQFSIPDVPSEVLDSAMNISEEEVAMVGLVAQMVFAIST